MFATNVAILVSSLVGRDGCSPERAHVGCFFETGACNFEEMPDMLDAVSSARRINLNMSDASGKETLRALEQTEDRLVVMESFRHHSSWWR